MSVEGGGGETAGLEEEKRNERGPKKTKILKKKKFHFNLRFSI